MNVILAKSAGFCFGVKRAVDTVYERILEKEPLYTFGPIITMKKWCAIWRKRASSW